jgi:arginyl-tRNA synthetase
MNIFADIRTAVVETLDAMVADGDLPSGLDYGAVAVEPPRDPGHGDLATNAAMVLAGRANRAPREVAQILADRMLGDARIESATVAGPGFLNLRLAPSVWSDVVTEALDAGRAFGHSGMGARLKVNVEYVSANPTGPLHVGHVRGAVFGDALAALLAFTGYEVTREYYVNDGGGQVDALARSVYLRYLEAHGEEVAFGEGHYPGVYLVDVGRALKDKVGDRFVGKGERDWLEEVRDFATDAMLDLIRADLEALGVRHDVFFSEKSLYGTGRIEAALRELDHKGLIYQGTLAPPKGHAADDWEPREQTLFRSTEHGDDVDRPVRKSDGSWTYFAPDIAYHHDKIARGFDELIDVFGADHGGYVKRMRAAVSALSDGSVPLDVKLTQLVRLMKGGDPVRMSKRAGNFVTLREVVDEVGPDVVRFHMLTRKNDAPLDFDFDHVTEQSKDNPVYYVQYAHARVRSLWRKAEAAGIMTTDVPLLEDEAEVAVARKIAEWPRLVEIASRNHEPHRIAFYLYDLASEFHALWNRGNDMPALRFIHEDDEARSAGKMALARAVGVVIATGLGILGVTPAEEMR